MPTHELLPEDLISYLDGDLSPAEKAWTEAHLATCPACRERLDGYREVARTIRAGTRRGRDPRLHAELMGRLEAEAARRERVPRSSRLLLLVVSLLLLVLAFTGGPTGSATGLRLQRFIYDFMAEPAPSPPQGTGAAPFYPVRAGSLPPNLELEGCAMKTTLVLRCTYRDPRRDMIVQLFQAPEAELRSAIQPTEVNVASVDGMEVLWVASHWPNSTDRLLWVRRGVAFDLGVTRAHAPGLSVDDAWRIVAALSEAQDEAD